MKLLEHGLMLLDWATMPGNYAGETLSVASTAWLRRSSDAYRDIMSPLATLITVHIVLARRLRRVRWFVLVSPDRPPPFRTTHVAFLRGTLLFGGIGHPPQGTHRQP